MVATKLRELLEKNEENVIEKELNREQARD